MNSKETLSKLKPVIIIILLFSVAFILRMDAMHISVVPQDYKSYYQDQNGLPYFSEMDSYYNYRLTQDYIDHGYLGDTIQNGTPWDLHSYYPYGRSAVYPPLIAIITAFVYTLFNSFTNVPLNAVAIWVAPFVASLAVIPAYLFVRRITNDYGGIAAGLLVATTYQYFQHTFAGFFDTDMFNMLFPILIVWFFVESIRAKDIRNRSIFIALSVVSMLVYSAAWEGWWTIFYVVIGSGIIYLLVSNYLFNMKTVKPFKEYPDKVKWFMDQPVLFSLVVFAVASSLLMIIYLGFSGFLGALANAIGASQIQNTIQGTGYPNIYVTVGELNPPTFWNVIEGIGGILPFALGILVIPLFLWKLKPDNDGRVKEVKAPKRKTKPRRREKRKAKIVEEKIEKKSTIIDPQVMETRKNYLLYAVLLSVWMLALGYAMTKGVRFIENFSVPVVLGAGIFIGLIVPYFKEHIKDTRYSAVAILVLIAVVVYAPASSSYTYSSTKLVPGTDDSMYDSLLWIKNNTSPNTVLTSWWDYGHLFAAVADRPVTFDGGSQNTPRAYWVGRALTTSDENLSAGILRMLTSSGNQGISTLENYTQDTGKSVEILNKILPVDKQAAQTILTTQYNLTQDQAQNVVKYTHPDNPAPHELILSPDMVWKASVWSYFGSWNFQNNTGQGHVCSAVAGTVSQVNGTIVIQAQNGVVAQINGTQITAGFVYSQNNQTQILAPYKLIVVQNGKVVMNQVVSNESQLSIIIIKNNNSYLNVVMTKGFENSMFSKMYFMNGAGLSRFKLAHTDEGVQVWNVN